MLGLLLDGEEAVQDADAALAGDRLGHLGLADGVHVGGHDRALQRDPAGERGAQRHVLAGADAAAAGDQQDVVEGEAEPDVVETHVVAP